MREYEITKSDIELIKRLERISIAIESLYEKMFSLEMEGKRDSEEFDLQIENLKIALDVENRIYGEVSLDYAKCFAFCDYILNNLAIEDLDSDYESLMKQDYADRPLRRITNFLTHKIKSDYSFAKDSLFQQPEYAQYMYDSKKEEKISTSIYRSTSINLAIERDIINSFLVLLQETIDSERNEQYRERLIKTKYNMSFIYRFVEETMIYNKFEIPELLNINSGVIADLTNASPEVYEVLKRHHGVSVATPQIAEILDISDEEYEDPQKVTTSILRQCLLRSTFLIMDEDTLENIHDEYHNFIESKDYLQDHHPGDHISEDAIAKCFRLVNKDKGRSYTFSMDAKK